MPDAEADEPPPHDATPSETSSDAPLEVSTPDAGPRCQFTGPIGLAKQRAAMLDTPLNRTQWLSAHNSWNDSNALWANQRWPVDKLLDNGIRGFDVDLPRRPREREALPCSCSAFYAAEDDYEPELAKYATFLRAHTCEILFIDIERIRWATPARSCRLSNDSSATSCIVRPTSPKVVGRPRAR